MEQITGFYNTDPWTSFAKRHLQQLIIAFASLKIFSEAIFVSALALRNYRVGWLVKKNFGATTYLTNVFFVALKNTQV